MTARNALAMLEALAQALHRDVALPPVSRCRQLADANPPGAAEKQPTTGYVEAIRATLRHACAANELLLVPRRTLRQASLVMWSGNPPAVEFPGLLEAFLEGAGANARWLSGLIDAWLSAFNPSDAVMVSIGHTIAQRLAVAEHPRLRSWHAAHAAFGIFDAAAGPERLAYALLHETSSLTTVLERAGLQDPVRIVGQYAKHVVKMMLGLLPSALRRSTAAATWSRAASVLATTHLRRGVDGRERSAQALRFPGLAGETARACLAPWISASNAAPNQDLREPIKAFLVGTLGDPRLEPTRWTMAGEAATALVRRWLAEATLGAFFSLLDRFSDDRQWRYRQRFWTACLKKRPDAEVWVVLDPVLADWARTKPDLAGSFALMGSSGSKRQAALLIRIGSTVLSEWSNVGALRAWSSTQPGCPKLYEREYTKRELNAPCLDFAGFESGGRGLWHRSPDRQIWQGHAAALLGQRENLWLNQGEYA